MYRIKEVWFKDDMIFVRFADGRIVGTPVAWYPNLRKGTPEQWEKYRFGYDNRSLHWEELDEDLSAEGFLKFSPELLLNHESSRDQESICHHD
ncbi:MAG: DUF2442 domain-containing protein [Flavisolibacter sp.]|nr:DUF2442 domain-containing protein [Flavisolibacter sp.]